MKSLEAVAVAIQADGRPIIWGKPGFGKTASIYEMGKALEGHTEVLIGSTMEPTDVTGIPFVHVNGDGQPVTTPALVSYGKRLVKAHEQGQGRIRGILFLDELSTAPPATQAVMLRVVQEGVIGELALPNTIAIICAANPPELAASGWTLSPPLANRLIHIEWDFGLDDFTTGMLQGWPKPVIPKVPEGWEQKYLPLAQAEVVSFLDRRKDLLDKIPEQEDEQGRAYPSPRSWTMAARLIAACQAAYGKQSTPVERLLVRGTIGDGAANELLAWRKEQDLPSPEECLKDPQGTKIPERGDQCYAIANAVAVTAVQKNHKDKKERWTAGITYLDRLKEKFGKDMVLPAVRVMAAHRAEAGAPLPAMYRDMAEMIQKVGA